RQNRLTASHSVALVPIPDDKAHARFPRIDGGRGRECILALVFLTLPQRSRRPGRPLLTPAARSRIYRIYKGSRARSSTPRVAAALLCRAWTAPLRCDPPRLWRFADPSVTGQFRPSKTEIDHEYHP